MQSRRQHPGAFLFAQDEETANDIANDPNFVPASPTDSNHSSAPSDSDSSVPEFIQRLRQGTHTAAPGVVISAAQSTVRSSNQQAPGAAVLAGSDQLPAETSIEGPTTVADWLMLVEERYEESPEGYRLHASGDTMPQIAQTMLSLIERLLASDDASAALSMTQGRTRIRQVTLRGLLNRSHRLVAW